jgi:hypothetical protein
MALIAKLTNATPNSPQTSEELANIINTLNNVDAGITPLNSLALTTGIKGTTTNNDAAAGYVGEYIESLVSSFTNTGASGNFYDITSIVLTAGDWDVDGLVELAGNGATFTNVRLTIGIGTVSGNSSTGLVNGKNESEFRVGANLLNFTALTLAIPVYRISIASNTTYYLKAEVDTFTAGTPQTVGRVTARRVR